MQTKLQQAKPARAGGPGWRGYGTALGIAISALWLAPVAHAGESPDKRRGATRSDIGSPSTDELLRRAEAASLRANFAEARRHLAEVFRRDASFEVTASLADLDLKVLDYLSAAEHARRALDLMPVAAPVRTRRDLEQILATASAHLGMLEITTVPSAAGIVLDGERSHLNPLVTPGTHEVRAHLTGYLDATARVEVRRQQVVQLVLELSPMLEPASARGPQAAVSVVQPALTLQAPSVARAREPARERSSSDGGPRGRDVLLAAGGGAVVLAAGFGATFLGWGGSAKERFGASGWLLGAAGLSLATSVSWQVWGVLEAPEERDPLGRMLLAGSSPGLPSLAKTVTVSSMHAATLAALALGIWKTVNLQNDLAADVRSPSVELDRKAAVGLLTAAGLLHVLSEALLEWWPNQRAPTPSDKGD